MRGKGRKSDCGNSRGRGVGIGIAMKEGRGGTVARSTSPKQTQLHMKFDNDEAKAYESINKAIANAATLLAIQLNELKEKSNEDLTKKDKQNYRREVAKQAKVAVKQIEPTNRLHIFMFRSTQGEWWKVGGNSVAIYQLMIGHYIDRQIKVNVDRDVFAVFKDGVICLPNATRMEKDIAYSGAQLKLDDRIDFGPFKDMIRAYRLPKPLQEREVRQFKNLDAEVLKTINNNIFATAPDVEINNHIVLALRESFKLERQMDSNARSFVGHPLLDSIFKMRREYYDVANCSRKDPKRYEAMERVDHCIGDAMAAMANYADLGIVDRERVARVSLELAKTRELARQKINQFRKKHEVAELLNELRADEKK